MAEGENPWTTLANKLLALGYEIAGAAGPEVLRNDDHAGDIRLLAVQLIARSLSNMRGALAMAGADLVVEARVLSRCILENQFWIAGFANNSAEFRKLMIEDDLRRRGAKAQTLFKTGELPDSIEGKLREWMRSNKAWQRAKSIAPKQLAQDAQIADAYLFYELLSTDAHPTVFALNRYVISRDGIEIIEIDLDPTPTRAELDDTVGLACFGLVNVLVGGCQILRSKAADRADELAREYLELMTAKAEPAERDFST